MCGIYGIYQRTNNIAIEPDYVRRMTAELEHRGPDEEGFFFSNEIGLGMRRLSIVDLATGQQPIWNENRTCCIIYNGELYNHLDLRPQLEAYGHVFTTQCDTEVILHAYEEWGATCVQRFNGMFAIAIWDQAARTLFLARDRIGEKPLYYYQDQDRLVFASEIKAILADRTIPRLLNVPGLANFLAFGRAAAPETIYKAICKLLPGHFLIARDGQIQIQPYWDVGDEPQIAPHAALSEADCTASLLSLLSDSVRRRMIADVPVGAFLSGGVDSSAIVALMKQHASGAVMTFSLGFAVGGAYNELSDARRVATYLGTEHYELNVEHVDLVHTLRTLVYHYDEPFGDAASFPVYLLSRFARQHVKVVLTGDGGDELFGGYRRYAVDKLAAAYQKLPYVLAHTVIPDVASRLPRLRRIKRVVRTLPIVDPARRYAAWLEVFSPDMQAELLRSEVLATLAGYDPAWQYPQYYSRLNRGTATDHLNQLMYIDLKTNLVDAYMEKIDKATMAASLEARAPLLDYRLVELAFQIPSSYKLRGWSTKRILKQAVSSLVPSEVLHKRKHGFAVPTDPWFRGELKDFTYEVLFDQRTRQRGYFNTQFIEKLWHEHVDGHEVWDTQLWLLLNFELWYRIYIDREPV